MSDESLRELLDQARKSVEQEIASTSQLKLERAAALDAKFQAFAKSVLPRLEMAKEQWLEEGILLEFSVLLARFNLRVIRLYLSELRKPRSATINNIVIYIFL
jgi:hypothetical protein